MPASTSTSAATAFPDKSWSTPARAYAPSATTPIQAERAAVRRRPRGSSGGAPQGEADGVVRDPVGPITHVVVHRPHELLRGLRGGQLGHQPRQALRPVHHAGATRLDQAVGVSEYEIAGL